MASETASATTIDPVMAGLEERIASLEITKQYTATKDAVQQVEMEMLQKLREIRAALVSSGQGAATATSKEVEELKKENADLKRKNEKLEYRVQHVVNNMEKMYKFVDDC